MKKKLIAREKLALSKVHKKYRVPDSCRTCAKVFTKPEFDNETEYYCHRDKSVRPRSGSSALDESFTPSNYKSRKYPNGSPEPGFRRNASNNRVMTAALEDYLKQYHRWKRTQEKKWEAWATPRRVHVCGVCPQHKVKPGIREVTS